MKDYEHTQAGLLMTCLLVAAAAMLAVTALTNASTSPGVAIAFGVLALVLLLCSYAFHSLTTTVSSEGVTVRFGPGWFRRKYSARDILQARVVRNRWYYGWGIRLTPHGWLFNVAGLDAVELQLDGGRKVRIGTDQPHDLLTAIESVQHSK